MALIALLSSLRDTRFDVCRLYLSSGRGTSVIPSVLPQQSIIVTFMGLSRSRTEISES